MLGPMGNLQMCDIYSYLWDACKQVGGRKDTCMDNYNVTEEMGFVKLGCVEQSLEVSTFP